MLANADLYEAVADLQKALAVLSAWVAVAAACAGLASVLIARPMLRIMLRRRRRRIALLHERLRVQVAEIEGLKHSCAQLEARLQRSLTRDLATGLPNRATFIEQLEARLAETRRARARARLWIVAIRLHKLDRLSHSLGAFAAHQLLRDAADRLGAALQGEVQIARIGDRELAISMTGTPNDGFDAIAGRVLGALSHRFEVAGECVYLHAALGIVSCTDADGEVGELIDKARLAADEALAKGRQWLAFREETQEQRVSMLHLEADLRHALDNDEFHLHFQPIVSMSERTVVGFEALLRWEHAPGTLLLPDQFIPLAENLGLMPHITEWVFREGVSRMKEWCADGHRLYLSMNLAPRDLNTRFCALILDLIDKAEIPAECVGVEITETAVVRDFKYAARLIGELSERGVRVLLDDFGTGYSSLSYLRELPFHCIKIDKSFVHRMTFDARDFGLVRSIVSLVHYLEMECVAEGIETQEQLDLISMIDCNYWQGNLYSVPVEASQAAALLPSTADTGRRWRLEGI